MQRISKKYILFTVIGILVLLASITLITYAGFSPMLTQKETNVITTLSCMEVAIDGKSDSLNLKNAYPLSDLQGNGLLPYTFTVKNNCDSYVEYDIVMSVINTGSSLNEEFIKVSLSGSNKLRSSILNKLKKETSIVVVENSLGNYILASSSFEGAVEHTYDFRMWLNADSENIWSDETISNKNFKVKLSIVAVTKNKPTLLKVVSGEETPQSKFLDGPIIREQIKAIKFTSNILNIENQDTWDVSDTQNGLVVASYKLDQDTNNYIITINQPGGVNLNKNSSYLFSNLSNIKTIDFTNTNSRYVVDMSYMFANVSNENFPINIVGLEKLNTGSVQNTSYMFMNFNSPEAILNFSDADISKIVNMDMMFANASVKEIRLDNWDQPTANLSSMFENVNPLTQIYLKSTGLKNMIQDLNIIDLNELNTRN